MSNLVDESELIAGLPQLYELQTLDHRIGELLEQREELDDGSHKRDQLERAQARREQVNTQLMEQQERQHDRQRERDMLQGRREKNQHRLWQENPTPQEYEALQADLQAVATRLDQIEIELKDCENRIGLLSGPAEDEQRTVSELEAELVEVVTKFAEEVKDIDSELSALVAARQAHIAAVSRTLYDQYERIRLRRGDPAVVRVTEDVCSCCHTQLTSFMLRQLHLAQQIQHCENCNSILYWAGEARPDFALEDWSEQQDSYEYVYDEDDDE
ncbi:MAG: hypothetical protein HYU66_03290 [Armatimonadetes bacterium]|nr:hypothetical protein [Armatimonadota bacterium]